MTRTVLPLWMILLVFGPSSVSVAQPLPTGPEPNIPGVVQMHHFACVKGAIHASLHNESQTVHAPVNPHNVVWDPSGRSALHKGTLSTAPTATLFTCRGDVLKAHPIERRTFRGPDVDVSQIVPGLDQMGWFRFTPDGARLVFAITAHSRRPNPDAPPASETTLLDCQFIIIDIDDLQTTQIDIKERGFNSYQLSNEHIVFEGHHGTYRADFNGEVVRLTPTDSQNRSEPSMSPDSPKPGSNSAQ